MCIAFQDLPKHEKVYIIIKLGLSAKEEKLLYLKYVENMSYDQIAREMSLSPKSVGALLTRVRKHAVRIANECYFLADDKCREIIDKVDWTNSSTGNRVRVNRMEVTS